MTSYSVDTLQQWWFSLSPIKRVAIFDGGNGRLKMALLNGQTLDVIHRMALLSDEEYDKAVARNGGRPGPYLMRVTPPGGRPQGIITGEQAQSYNQIARPEGASRYIQEYYGYLFINMLARMLPFDAEVYSFVSHAPRDFEYRKEQKRAIRGEWVVEVGNQRRVYSVIKAWNYDEPYGGYANLAMCPDGSRNKLFLYYDGKLIVIDVGFLTTDVMVVNAGGIVDTNLIDSIPLGIGQVVRDFHNAFKAKHAKMLQMGSLTDEQIYSAIRTGVLVYNGYEYDCTDEVRPAMTRLTNGIRDYVRTRIGGFGVAQGVAFTGGGGGMTYPYQIQNMDGFNPDHVMLVAPLDKMTVANAIGGIPLWNLGVATGAVR